MLDEAVTVTVIQVDDDFGIGLRVEAVPLRDQRSAQFHVVEDRAIEHGPDVAAFVVDGLVAADQIDDREPRRGESDAGIDIKSVSVRPAVMQGVNHPFQFVARLADPATCAAESCYSSHVSLYSPDLARCSASASAQASKVSAATAPQLRE